MSFPRPCPRPPAQHGPQLLHAASPYSSFSTLFGEVSVAALLNPTPRSPNPAKNLSNSTLHSMILPLYSEGPRQQLLAPRLARSSPRSTSWHPRQRFRPLIRGHHSVIQWVSTWRPCRSAGQPKSRPHGLRGLAPQTGKPRAGRFFSESAWHGLATWHSRPQATSAIQTWDASCKAALQSRARPCSGNQALPLFGMGHWVSTASQRVADC
jgi:hypothetical protein